MYKEMTFSVLGYYLSVHHEKSVNFIYAFYHLPFLWSIRCTITLIGFAIYSITSISDSLSNVCGYALALIVRLFGIDYLVVEDGIL